MLYFAQPRDEIPAPRVTGRGSIMNLEQFARLYTEALTNIEGAESFREQAEAMLGAFKGCGLCQHFEMHFYSGEELPLNDAPFGVLSMSWSWPETDPTDIWPHLSWHMGPENVSVYYCEFEGPVGEAWYPGTFSDLVTFLLSHAFEPPPRT